MKRTYYILSGALLLLIITNPTYKDFKESEIQFRSESQYKLHNYYIFSTYRAFYRRGLTDYFGVLGNFFEISSYTNPAPPIDSAKMGSSKMMDTAK
jgi:hypothetical protein